MFEHLHHDYFDGERVHHVASATEAGTRWLQGAQGAQSRYVQGVQTTTKDPTALAAAQAQKMLLGVQNAINSGFWARRLADVGKGGWIAAVVAKANNYSTGIAAGQTAFEQGYTAFWNYMTPQLNTILAMPKVTDADSEARMLAFTRAARAYQKA